MIAEIDDIPRPGNLRPLLLAQGVVWLTAEAASLTGIAAGPLSLLPMLIGNEFFASAMAGAFLILAASRPGASWLAFVVTGGGLITALLHGTLPGRPLVPLAFVGLGLAALTALGVRAFRARGSNAADRARTDLAAALVVPVFVVESGFFLGLSAALHPLTYDLFAFAADAGFGFQASLVAGRLFESVPALSGAAGLVYVALPAALVAVWLGQRRRRPAAAPDALVAFIAIAVVGYTFYMLYPIAGPAYVLRGYPRSEPAVPALIGLLLAQPVPRNCMPSLHASWALAIFWLARPFGRVARAVASLFLGLTVLATLGLGFHYLVDLIVAVPFTVAVLSAVSSGQARWRWRAVVAGLVAVLGWLALIRLAPQFLARSQWFVWPLAVATVVVPSWLWRRVEGSPAEVRGPALPAPAMRPFLKWAVVLLFFLSGFAALSYEVVFAKSFAVTFGSTARAAAVVLAVYMGGLAAGSWMGGRLADRVARPLRAFALAELAIAAWCALFPFAIRIVHDLYVRLAGGSDPASPGLIPLQLLLMTAALLPATLVMGLTLPLLASLFTRRALSLGHAAGYLYGVNTAGAAAGALLAGYVLLPALGISGTTLAAVAIDLAVALLALRLSAREEQGARQPDPVPGPTTDQVGTFGVTASTPFLVAAGAGAVTFALETIYIHLLAVVAGNSAYAFSLMVFAFLVGLSAGAALGRRLLATGADPRLLVALLQAGLGAIVLLGVFIWDAIPGHFAAFEAYPLARTFGSREAIRFMVCMAAMVPPALFIGASFPSLVEWASRSDPKGGISSLGRLSAMNTVGNIGGALLGGFVLIPMVGSMRAIQIVAVATLGLSVVAAFALRRARLVALVATGCAALLVLAQPREFDLDRLASGANVYFTEQSYGRVIDHAESQDGGLTTIVERTEPDGSRVVTMLTNGKFQGDDGRGHEMVAQSAFTLFPLLHTEARDSALIIGLGTGVSARVASDAGFREVRVAELSGDVARLAERYFGGINGNVLHRPNTILHVTDGRNLLALDPRRHDLIGIEVSSIWFAGAANLYNRDFYALTKSRLSARGVLQQWMQIHRLSRLDLVTILASVRAEFPYVWLYFAPNQGVIVACAWDCSPSRQAVDRLRDAPALQDSLRLTGGVPRLLEQRLLSPADVDRLLASELPAGARPEELVSTDDNLFLEYSTPRANVRPYGPSLQENLRILGAYRPSSALVGTRLEAGDANR